MHDIAFQLRLQFALRSLAPSLGSDYDAYLKDVQELCHGMAREGCRVVKIDVKPADLLAWCQARGVEVNSKSRAEYAADRIREMHQMR